MTDKLLGRGKIKTQDIAHEEALREDRDRQAVTTQSPYEEQHSDREGYENDYEEAIRLISYAGTVAELYNVIRKLRPLRRSEKEATTDEQKDQFIQAELYLHSYGFKEGIEFQNVLAKKFWAVRDYQVPSIITGKPISRPETKS